MMVQIEAHGDIPGLNVGFQPNKRASDLASAQLGSPLLCRMENIPVEILLLDVAKEYDSVSWKLLEMSLKRVSAPEGLIKLLGALPWLLVYDSILTATNREYPWVRNTDQGLSTAAMADDLSLMAYSRTRLQQIANFVSGWFRMAGVRVNATKTEHLSYGSSENAPVVYWQYGEGTDGQTAIMQRLHPGHCVRILGQNRTKSRTGLGRLWNPSLSRVISKYEMTVESPRRYGGNKKQIMAAFQRLLPDNVIESLYAYGISEIAQAFWMTKELGSVYQNEQARPGLGRTSMHRMRGGHPQWKRFLETETANIHRGVTDVRDAIVDLEDSEEIEVYTDGSLVDTPLSQSMGFGVLFRYRPWGRQSFEEERFRGCCMEALFSSTMAEVMAIFMALALAEVGPQKALEIKTDSRAIIGALKRSSPMAALLEWRSIWFEEYWDSVKFTWVKGHSGNLHNAEADRPAGSAHGNEQLVWSLKLGASRTAPFWTCWNDQPAPGKPGSLIKRIERTVVGKRLLAQVRVANPQEQIEQEDVKDTMAASTWFSAGNGKFHAKNSFRKTTERDTSERSLVYKLLLGNIPVMKREATWYLQAYPEPEM
ncbi:hypothetical protein EV179_004662 [Coemansia sp. RSA 487]|nr:hypothetical protein EV179_004662 [Coemansia sp. RSA 487]